jgi:ATP-dependent helicase/nuclease subunit B
VSIGYFTLTAKADRIDEYHDGSIKIIDYKTGNPPSSKDVSLGLSPQLSLEGAILQGGGFKDVLGRDLSSLEFWWLRGGAQPCEVKDVSGDSNKLAEEALAGLMSLLDHFQREDTPYRSVPRPQSAPQYNDYAHLSRVEEWSRGQS